jgi:hypothetical protein
MIAPVAPPTAAPIIAPIAVFPEALPITAPAAPPPAVPIMAPFWVLFIDEQLVNIKAALNIIIKLTFFIVLFLIVKKLLQKVVRLRSLSIMRITLCYKGKLINIVYCYTTIIKICIIHTLPRYIYPL